MKVLVLGTSGQVGDALMRADWPAGTTLVGLARPDIDMARPETIDAAVAAHAPDLAPDLVVNATAYTAVDKAESDREAAFAVNRDGPARLAAACAARGIPLVHISTDYVFDGEAGPYSEDDPTRPISVYGSTKLESEKLVLSQSHRSLIVRTMTLWGRGKGAKTSFVDFVANSLKEGKTVRIVTDQLGNATLAEDLALGIWKLVDGGNSGIYHVAGSERNSRFEWAQAIADHYGLDRSLIQPCLTADLKQAALRPLNSGLRTDKLTAATGFVPRDIAGQIRRMDELTQSIS